VVGVAFAASPRGRASPAAAELDARWCLHHFSLIPLPPSPATGEGDSR
jgi:hypothetical protein